MRRSIALALTSTLVLLGASAAAQDAWRASALAAFDEVWRTIADTHYDPSFNGVDWPSVKAELRPRAERARTPDEVRETINEMLGRLGESHYVLLTSSAAGRPLPGSAAVPIEIRSTSDGIVVTRVEPELSGLVQAGDLIVAIDGVNPVQAAEGRDDRARRLDAWRRTYRALHGSAASVARLTLVDLAGRERTVETPRARKSGAAVSLGNLPEVHVRTSAYAVRSPASRRVGVIAFTAWMPVVAEPIAQAVDEYRQADGIVIDLRGNTGGLADMMRGVAGHFLAEPSLLGRLRMRQNVLEFRANPRRSTSDGRVVEPFSGALAILVDELTASASECFAGALQSLGRARIVGSRTMGQALPAATRSLPNGDVLMYVVGDFTTSTGMRLEGAGVRPDEEVALSRRALYEGRDEALARALDWIDRQPAR